MRLLALFVAMATLYYVDATVCYTCVYMSGTSDNDAMAAILATMTDQGQVHCKDNPSDAIPLECNSQELPPGATGFNCVATDISASMSMDVGQGPMEATMQYVIRGCNPVFPGDNPLGCQPAANYRDMIEAQMGGAESGMQLGDVTGAYCLCDTSHCNNHEVPIAIDGDAAAEPTTIKEAEEESESAEKPAATDAPEKDADTDDDDTDADEEAADAAVVPALSLSTLAGLLLMFFLAHK